MTPSEKPRKIEVAKVVLLSHFDLIEQVLYSLVLLGLVLAGRAARFSLPAFMNQKL